MPLIDLLLKRGSSRKINSFSSSIVSKSSVHNSQNFFTSQLSKSHIPNIIKNEEGEIIEDTFKGKTLLGVNFENLRGLDKLDFSGAIMDDATYNSICLAAEKEGVKVDLSKIKFRKSGKAYEQTYVELISEPSGHDALRSPYDAIKKALQEGTSLEGKNLLGLRIESVKGFDKLNFDGSIMDSTTYDSICLAAKDQGVNVDLSKIIFRRSEKAYEMPSLDQMLNESSNGRSR